MIPELEVIWIPEFRYDPVFIYGVDKYNEAYYSSTFTVMFKSLGIFKGFSLTEHLKTSTSLRVK